MGMILSAIAYLLTALLSLSALILVMEWILFYMPGALWNGARKGLFNLTFPLLSWSERFCSLRWGRIHSRGLFPAFLLLAVGYLGVPWLVLLCYSLRG